MAVALGGCFDGPTQSFACGDTTCRPHEVCIAESVEAEPGTDYQCVPFHDDFSADSDECADYCLGGAGVVCGVCDESSCDVECTDP